MKQINIDTNKEMSRFRKEKNIIVVTIKQWGFIYPRPPQKKTK